MSKSVKKGANKAMTKSEAGTLNSRLAGRLLRRLPGGDFAQAQLDRIENRMLGELKHRLDDLGEPQSMSVLAVSIGGGTKTDTRASRLPGDLLRHLLERSSEQLTPEQAEAEYFLVVLRELVPDQARILSALSDGSTYPLIHVMSGSRLGPATRAEVECVSNVGKNAGVQNSQLTHLYVQHLRRLGLVEIDAVEGEDSTRYQILETEDAVRKAQDRIKKSGRRCHILRYTLKLSDFGERLWAACRLSEE